MRELKFRAWDDANKCFPLIGFDILGETTVFDLCSQYQLEHALKLNIDQATGLKDKNGLDIYEGDILKTKITIRKVIEVHKSGFWKGSPKRIVDIEEEGIVKCEWQTIGFKFVNLFPENSHGFNIPSFEVIGNIHQHPELLNTDK